MFKGRISGQPKNILGMNNIQRVKDRTSKKTAEQRTGIALLLIELIMIVLFALFINYGRDADPKAIKVKATHLAYYSMFQDVHVMMLIGFGFLMTFLRKYGYSSLGFNFLLCAVVLQWGLLSLAIFNGPGITVLSLVKADILLAAVLISFGAVLGKTSPLELVIMAIIEAPIYSLNCYIGEYLDISDPGGSIFVHAFGAYFGLSVSRILGAPKNRILEHSSYSSDIFAMIGTLFLWVFWPSFNGILSSEDDQQRAIINTYISLTASCITAFAISSITDANKRFTMAHIQNATLAGGVAVGTVAELLIHPYGALTIGACAGILSTIGFAYIQDWLEKRIGLHDTCGVNNLHGIPAIFAAILGAIIASVASKETYGPRLFTIYKSRAPVAFSQELKELQINSIQMNIHILPGEGRSALAQGGYQLLGIALTIALAIIAGSFTGMIIRLCQRYIGSVKEEYMHDDELHWNLPDEEKKEKPSLDIETISNNTLNVA